MRSESCGHCETFCCEAATHQGFCQRSHLATTAKEHVPTTSQSTHGCKICDTFCCLTLKLMQLGSFFAWMRAAQSENQGRKPRSNSGADTIMQLAVCAQAPGCARCLRVSICCHPLLGPQSQMQTLRLSPEEQHMTKFHLRHV